MEIKYIFDIIVKYVVPLIAIVISIFSLRESRKVNKIQLRLNEMDEKLKRYELEEIKKVREAADKSMVEARIYKVSKGKYRLKIWNSGQAGAYDVDFKILDDMKGIVYRDKVPFEILEAGKSFDEHITYYMGMPSKLKIKTIWKDANRVDKEKDQIVTF